jgi:putative oxidoreductase
MKNLFAILSITLSLFFSNCVQKTFTKTVVYTLRVDSTQEITSVGIRGTDKPLDWNTDYELKEIQKGVLYQAVVTYHTGYKFTEAKFTLNGEFELQNDPNRRIAFSDSDTTYYEATFNSVK